ncbi:hypothetical protein LTR20_008341 [Exophiala xenobiotica]|nr:hypothetical protein LTR79_003490 [Exophiala xenobiotica]KAK5458853.1 hypothetical protein LTR20_008341 [Exophiala xenobiotica]KAK5491254.1 hypothetical protein LTR26_004016 [Exophiala xenobiotica]KAK5493693.1 hypothetical protein LTR83_006095 [Exophiala xenobiotica]KAK5517630.1 hypothetical protein LTR07_006501 [Exophiala xenobiotica]
MTIQMCLSFCTSQNLPLAGLEYSRECYCSSSSSLPPNTPLNYTDCNMPCAGDPTHTQTCGGSSRLSIYNNTALSPPSAKPQISPGYTYQGCFTDPSSSQRTLSGYSTSTNAMTQEVCVSTCSGRGYKYAGVEYARECYCSNVLGLVANGTGKGVQTGEGDCMVTEGMSE